MEADYAKQDKICMEDFLRGDQFVDSVLFRNARWKVMLSEKFRESFGKLNSASLKKLVITLLLRLANGWRPKRVKVDFLCERSSMVLKKFKVQDLYVVCSVDMVKAVWYIQVLKVWDILPLLEIPVLVERLDSIFCLYTDEYLCCCKVKCVEGDLEVPMSWEQTDYMIRYRSYSNPGMENSMHDDSIERKGLCRSSKVNGSFLLMKFYSLSSGIARHLLAGCSGKEVGLPFELNDEEMEIVLFTRSCFILGRSGTGKTSVSIAKLYRREQLHHIALEGFHGNDNLEPVSDGPDGRRDEQRGRDEGMDGACLCQLFVTVNPKLCRAIRQNIAHLKRSSCGLGCLCQISSAVVDADVDVDEGDDTSQFSSIPDSFSELSPSSYPLVVTFSKFLMMLDGTLSCSFFERFPEARRLSNGRHGSGRTVELDTFIRTKEVTYEKFHSSYWPHFNVQSKNGLDSSTIFTEIISSIKGGSRGVESNDFKLSRDSYILLSKSRVSVLDESARERVYDIFLQYEKQKKQNGEFDLADLVNNLHFRLKNERYRGHEMDFVYIDEVQDLSMRSISLLKYVCRNYVEGFVFSGDTAQAITKGVNFRFQDIRYLFYDEFVEDSSLAKFRKDKRHETTNMFHLRRNFRTHEGVLKLARSVINLIYHFFPNTIDVLDPEGSPVCGESPVLLTANEEKFSSIFRNIAEVERKVVGFGADQVILVRDDTAKRRIFNVVGKNALVMTIMECKGLEFQDVLLYNFFGSSPLKNKWRLIYQYMKKENLLLDSSPSFPCFNDKMHFCLCSELKQLYVAITRTRQRLWIFESDDDFSCPMFDYWLRLCVVRVRQLDSTFAEEMQVASSCEDWKSRGIKLFDQHNYEMAKISFERAGDKYKAKWAEAAHLQETSNNMRVSRPKVARFYLQQAAEIYLSIGRAECAAECFCECKEYEQAAKIYLDNFGGSRLKEAGECLHLAGCYERAAKVFSRCELYSNCLSACTDGKLYDIGLQYINSWREMFSNNGISNEIENIALRFLKKAACQYHKLKDYKSMMKYVQAFNSKDSIRAFLKEIDFLDELLSLEIKWGGYSEAADIAKLKGGDALFEVDILEKAGRLNEASLLIINYVFSKSLWALGSNGWPLKSFMGKENLLTKAISLAQNVSKHFHEFISMEAVALSEKSKSLDQLRCHMNKAQRCNNLSGEILSARRILDANLSADSIVLDDYLVANECSFLREDSASWPSLKTLLYCWNFWNDRIVKILDSLESLEAVQDSHAEFCLNYFGARMLKTGKGAIIVLQNPEAIWVRMLMKCGKERVMKLESFGVTQFVAAARVYWLSEIHSVGLNVLNYLEGLYEFSVNNSLSMCVQSFVLTHIFRVAKFLSKSQLLGHSRIFHHGFVHRFLEFSALKFFGNLNRLDYKSQTLDMVVLRDNSPRALVEEIILGDTNFHTELNFRNISSIMAVILGCTNLSFKVSRRIESRFGDDQLWGPVMECIINKGGSNSKDGSLVSRLHEALIAIYDRKCNWNHDCPSPGIFISLIERLLVLVFCLKGFFFMPRTAVVEWLIYRGWNATLDFNSTMNNDSSMEFTLDDVAMNDDSSTKFILDDVAHIVEQLLANRGDTLKWVRNSGLDLDSYPLLVLRLIVIVFILGLSFKKYNEKYNDLLVRLLSRREITSLLPWKFFSTLAEKSQDDSLDVFVLAKAMQMIGNPLVVVKYGGHGPDCPKAIILDLKINQHKRSLLKVLFPEETACPRLMKACRKVYYLRRACQGSRTRTRDELRYKSYHYFWETLESLVSTEDQLSEPNLASQASSAKVVVLDTIFHVTAIYPSEKSVNGPPHCLDQVNRTIDKLQQLYSFLDSRESMGKARELIECLLAERPKLQPSCSKLITNSAARCNREKKRVGAGGHKSRKRNYSEAEDGTKNPIKVEEREQGIVDLEAQISVIEDKEICVDMNCRHDMKIQKLV